MKKKIVIGTVLFFAVASAAIATSGIPLSELAHHALCYIGLDGEVVHVGHDH